MNSTVIVNKQQEQSTTSRTQTAFEGLRGNITTPNLVGLLGGILALFLLIALHDPWNISLPLYLTAMVWTILRPRVALYLMPIAVPWGSLNYLNVGGLNLNSADLLVAFLAAGWLMSFALPASKVGGINGQENSRAKVPSLTTDAESLDRNPAYFPTYLAFAILALLTTMLLSMTVAISITSSLKEISKWLEFLVLVLVGTQYIRTRRQLWTIIIITCLAGISQALFGYVQVLFNLGPASFVRDASLRIYGTFGQPNPYAGYLNIVLSISLALMLLGSNWKTRILAGLTTVLLGVAEYLTQSRGGEIAIGAAALFIVAVGIVYARPVLGALTLAVLGAIEAFLVGLIPAHIFDSVLNKLGVIGINFAAPTQENFSTAERLAHWIAGLRMFFAHPILGVGIGNYADAYPHYFIAIWTDPLGHAHNYYINIAAETGSIGLTAYLLFLLATFIAGWHSYRVISKKCAEAQVQRQVVQFKQVALPLGIRQKLYALVHSLGIGQPDSQQTTHEIASMLNNDRALAIGLLAALVSICVHNVFDNLYVHSLTNLMALLVIALIRLEGVTSKVGNYGGRS